MSGENEQFGRSGADKPMKIGQKQMLMEEAMTYLLHWRHSMKIILWAGKDTRQYVFGCVVNHRKIFRKQFDSNLQTNKGMNIW